MASLKPYRISSSFLILLRDEQMVEFAKDLDYVQILTTDDQVLHFTKSIEPVDPEAVQAEMASLFEQKKLVMRFNYEGKTDQLFLLLDDNPSVKIAFEHVVRKPDVVFYRQPILQHEDHSFFGVATDNLDHRGLFDVLEFMLKTFGYTVVIRQL